GGGVLRPEPADGIDVASVGDDGGQLAQLFELARHRHALPQKRSPLSHPGAWTRRAPAPAGLAAQANNLPAASRAWRAPTRGARLGPGTATATGTPMADTE